MGGLRQCKARFALVLRERGTGESRKGKKARFGGALHCEALPGAAWRCVAKQGFLTDEEFSMQIDVTIKGTTPLLMNRFHEGAEVAVSGGTAVTFKGDKGTPREQATPKAYRERESGKLFIPGPNIFAALISAGKFHKAGKSKLTTQKTSLVPAGLTVNELICPLGVKDFEVDSRSVVIPSTGGRVMCHRPRIDEWKCTFSLDVDTEMFAPKLVRALVDDAGKKVGLGDFRPERKGPFGKFVVVNWVERKERTGEAA